MIKVWEGTEAQLGWVVGFMEGEGCFCPNKITPQIQVTQKDIEPLLRLEDIVGGSISRCSRGYYHWYMSTKPARDLMLILKPFFSKRRQGQIDVGLDRCTKYD